MSSFVPRDRARRGRPLLDALNAGQEGPRQTVTIRLDTIERVRVRDLGPLPEGPEAEALIKHALGRARARMEDDMIAAATGQPLRHELKPAKAVRVR